MTVVLGVLVGLFLGLPVTVLVVRALVGGSFGLALTTPAVTDTTHGSGHSTSSYPDSV